MPVFVNMSTTFGLYGSLLVLSKYLTPKAPLSQCFSRTAILDCAIQYNYKFRSLRFHKKIEDCGYIPVLGLQWFLRIMVTNPTNSPDNY
jgi:hypothetical protein